MPRAMQDYIRDCLAPAIDNDDPEAIHKALRDVVAHRLLLVGLCLIPLMGVFIFIDPYLFEQLDPQLGQPDLPVQILGARWFLVALQVVVVVWGARVYPRQGRESGAWITGFLVAELVGLAVFVGLWNRIEPALAYYLMSVVAFGLFFAQPSRSAALVFGGGCLTLEWLVATAPNLQASHVPVVLLTSILGFIFSRVVYNARVRELVTTRALQHGRQTLAIANANLAQAAEEARALAAEAKAAEVAKSTFLANMSHELRTPMNGVLGMTELVLAAGPRNDEQRECLETVMSCGQSLLRLVDDILDLSKIEAKKLSLESFDIELRRLTEDVVAPLRVLAARKGLEIRINVDPTLPAYVRTDPLRLGQVLTNLVGNAIKFTAAGYVAVDISVVSQAVEAVDIRFAVRDTGPGIAAHHQAAIFEAFEQLDNSMTRTEGGTGLGLTISARLVEYLGGHLCVTSREGEGSTFSFELPLTRGDAVAARESVDVPVPDRPLRLLVAEDNPVNQELARRMLQLLGHEVQLVNDGVQALEALKSPERFDAAFVDIQMPNLDGFGVADQWRAHEHNAQCSPVFLVALTAHAMQGDRDYILSAGFDGYVSKPFNSKSLREALRLLPRPEKPAPAPTDVIG